MDGRNWPQPLPPAYSCASRPPSTTKVVPWIKLASDEAKKAMAAASSAGVPTVALSIFSVPFFTLGLLQSMGVSTAPGATALMRVCRRSSSRLMPRTKASMPPLLVA